MKTSPDIDPELFSSKLLSEALGSQFDNCSHDVPSVQQADSGAISISQTKSHVVPHNNNKMDNKKDSLIVLSHPSPETKDELIEVALDYTEQIVARILGSKKRAILEEKTSCFNGSVMKLV
jgi:hypothetical protein